MSDTVPKPQPRPTETPEWAKGMKKLHPGYYVDQAGGMHICESELCAYLGLPETKENVEMIRQTMLVALAEAGARELHLTVIDHHSGRQQDARVLIQKVELPGDGGEKVN